jgi:hypothetical protein
MSEARRSARTAESIQAPMTMRLRLEFLERL